LAGGDFVVVGRITITTKTSTTQVLVIMVLIGIIMAIGSKVIGIKAVILTTFRFRSPCYSFSYSSSSYGCLRHHI
jgi:hypothetical protein